jgi:hypothetical protein
MEKHFQNMPPTEELKKLYEEILRYERQLANIEELPNYEQLMASKLSRSSSYLYAPEEAVYVAKRTVLRLSSKL